MHRTCRWSNSAVLPAALVVLLAGGSACSWEGVESPAVPTATPAAAALPAVFGDGVNASPRRVDRMHGTRYVEIVLAATDPASGREVAACFNSMYTGNGLPRSKDTAPQALIGELDVEAMKKSFGVPGASFNGPKLWLPDWSELGVGRERDFNGLKAAWVAHLGPNTCGTVGQSTPYVPRTVERAGGAVGWKKGATVLLLDDPDGNTWVMKDFHQGMRPLSTYGQFVARGARNFTKLPPGWSFRVKVLDRELIERPTSGVATVVADEFFNMYDRTDPTMTNYQP